MSRANISFFGIRGTQANIEYYVCMVLLSMLPKLFVFSNYELTPVVRAQRILNKARIPEMKQYILQNRETYVFSVLTVSVDGEINFKPIDDSKCQRTIGKIEISFDTKILINDGQHRKEPIETALEECPSLKDEDIAVVLFPDTGLKRSQSLLKGIETRDQQSIVRSFWGILYTAIQEWKVLVEQQIRISHLRSEHLSGHAIVSRALALMGNELLRQGLSLESLEGIKEASWKKDNPLWQGHVVINNTISAPNSSVQYISSIVRDILKDGEQNV